MSSGPAATETAPRDPVFVPHLCVAPEVMCGGRSLTHLPHSLISATQPHASEERAMTHPPRRGETRSPPRSLAVPPPPPPKPETARGPEAGEGDTLTIHFRGLQTDYQPCACLSILTALWGGGRPIGVRLV